MMVFLQWNIIVFVVFPVIMLCDQLDDPNHKLNHLFYNFSFCSYFTVVHQNTKSLNPRSLSKILGSRSMSYSFLPLNAQISLYSSILFLLQFLAIFAFSCATGYRGSFKIQQTIKPESHIVEGHFKYPFGSAIPLIMLQDKENEVFFSSLPVHSKQPSNGNIIRQIHCICIWSLRCLPIRNKNLHEEVKKEKRKN